MSQFTKLILNPLKKQVKVVLAKIYRPALRNVCFIGVTGSCGKTTATELIAAILEKLGLTVKLSYQNTLEYLVNGVMGVSPRNNFCVCEISGDHAGAIHKAVKLLKPRIGVVLNVGQDHYSNFRNLEATAAEKEKLVRALPADGTAVLNADDPYVFEMRKQTKARIITYGLSPEATVRGENVSSIWPKRLSLDVCFDEKRFSVQTRLLGEHWVYPVLAAISTAIVAGASPECAAETIEKFEPLPYRMCPHQTPDGVTFISDNRKAPLWAFSASLDFMRKAKAPRKILIVGSVSDTPKSFADRYKTVIRQALGAVDKIIIVGEHSLAALRARPESDDDRVMAFGSTGQLNTCLNDYLRPGDLVLLKGLEPADHLERIILSRTGSVVCWKQDCGHRRFCTTCKLLTAQTEIRQAS